LIGLAAITGVFLLYRIAVILGPQIRVALIVARVSPPPPPRLYLITILLLLRFKVSTRKIVNLSSVQKLVCGVGGRICAYLDDQYMFLTKEVF
jgi:hypothetical protein